MSDIRFVSCLVMLAAAAVLAGCATPGDGSLRPERARFSAGWQRSGDAALDAVRDPWVWAPLAGAAALQIGNADHRLSRWANEHTPLFGSVKDAKRAGDDLEIAALAGYAASTLAVPSRAGGPQAWREKLDDGLVGIGALATTGLATEVLKRAAGRDRPNGGHDGFPSGHTSFVAAADVLTVRNLRDIPMSDGARAALTVGAGAVTFATGWARVEAGAHYPSDVLVGLSLGNFFGHVFTHAFLDEATASHLSLTVAPARGGGTLAVSWLY